MMDGELEDKYPSSHPLGGAALGHVTQSAREPQCPTVMGETPVPKG